MSELSREEKMQIIEEYMSDPYNQINASVSASVSLAVNALGPKDTLEILANYMGMVMGSALVFMDEGEGEILIDDFADRMREVLREAKVKQIDTDLS